MLTEREQADLHLRLQQIAEDAETAKALDAVRLATALRQRAQDHRHEPPLRMR
jgi:hypothetical protein